MRKGRATGSRCVEANPDVKKAIKSRQSSHEMCGMARNTDTSSPRPLTAKLRRIFSFTHSGNPSALPISDQMASGDQKTRGPPPGPYDLVESFNGVISKRDKGEFEPIKSEEKDITPTNPEALIEKSEAKYNKLLVNDATKEYFLQREEVQRRENALGFDHHCTKEAEEWEVDANTVFQKLKKLDVEEVYDKEARIEGYAGQEHKRVPGDRFLLNAPIIEKTRLYRAIQKMPKGAHLHIHFNANLLPEVLLNIAKEQDHMYIQSDIPLTSKEAFERCHLRFSILSKPSNRPNLFTLADPLSVERSKGETENEKHVMSFKAFRAEFVDNYTTAYVDDDRSLLRVVAEKDLVDEYLTRKIVFQADEAYSPHQTAKGAWQRFNAHTKMMKGLFNYYSAYKEYTQKCLWEFVDDNIQYAEIRPNFMKNNQVWFDDGTGQTDNFGIMNLIIGEYEKFQKAHGGKVFKGLKIIYCTPRSFDPEQVKFALDECLDMKRHEKYGKYIAGFDLVGEEGNGHPLSYFIPQFLEFKEKCKDKPAVEIPFLFHCGETLDVGTETDGNLVDALLLGSKRIGHGFALAWHPYIMQQMKKRNICVEVCPISNEILGLTPRISGHTVYSLLANDVHCTLSTDNGTLFRSRLSHDFYQITVGKADMTLHGLRQLIEWSIDHAMMDDEERNETRKTWEKLWKEFCIQLFEEGKHLPKEKKNKTEENKNKTEENKNSPEESKNLLDEDEEKP